MSEVILRLHEFRDALPQVVERIGGVQVGVNAKRVCLLRSQQLRDFTQFRGYLVVESLPPGIPSTFPIAGTSARNYT